MSRFRKITIRINIFDIEPLTTFMRENSIPYLAKLSHQNKWSCSRQTAGFFQKDGFAASNQSEQAIKMVKLNLKIIPADIVMVKLRNTKGKISPYRAPRSNKNRWTK